MAAADWFKTVLEVGRDAYVAKQTGRAHDDEQQGRMLATPQYEQQRTGAPATPEQWAAWARSQAGGAASSAPPWLMMAGVGVVAVAAYMLLKG